MAVPDSAKILAAVTIGFTNRNFFITFISPPGRFLLRTYFIGQLVCHGPPPENGLISETYFGGLAEREDAAAKPSSASTTRSNEGGCYCFSFITRTSSPNDVRAITRSN